VASIQKTSNGRYRARYRDSTGKEHLKRFALKRDAQRWLDTETSKLQTGTWVAPRTAKMTMTEWCTTWLAGYAARRPNTVRQARVQVAKISDAFGDRRLDSIRPSEIRSWLVELKEAGHADSYIAVLHTRLSQILSDAVHDGVLGRSPASRRTSPRTGKPRPYVATTGQVWALHDAIPERYQAAILLGAFAGLRVAEVCGLRVQDVDFIRGVIHPVQQWPAEELKTEISRTPIPIPHDLALMLSAHVERFSTAWVMTNEAGRQLHPQDIRRVIRDVRGQVQGLPNGFRFHDLRHYYASLLINAGLDVKVVQARLRHASAKTTLDTYGHLWPDSDETTRAAVEGVLEGRGGTSAANMRPFDLVEQRSS
jgi:integrase